MLDFGVCCLFELRCVVVLLVCSCVCDLFVIGDDFTFVYMLIIDGCLVFSYFVVFYLWYFALKVVLDVALIVFTLFVLFVFCFDWLLDWLGVLVLRGVLLIFTDIGCFDVFSLLGFGLWTIVWDFICFGLVFVCFVVWLAGCVLCLFLFLDLFVVLLLFDCEFLWFVVWIGLFVCFCGCYTWFYLLYGCFIWVVLWTRFCLLSDFVL